MKDIEIFRAGTHLSSSGNKVTITVADLAACAKAYDKQLHEAPIVAGHPKTNHPAYGWVDGLKLDGDTLIATPAQVEPQFAQMVEDGRFKKRSASFFGPADPLNPTPGVFHLKHVGFLGAVPPAVPGLKEIEFSQDDQAIEFANWQQVRVARVLRGVKNFFIAQFGPEKAEEAMPESDLELMALEAASDPDTDCDPQPAFSQPTPSGDDVSTQEQQLSAREKKLADDEIAFAQRQAKERRAGDTAFIDGLIKVGQFPPKWRDETIEFMQSLPAGDDASFEFAQADGTKKTVQPGEWFKGLLGRLPKLVPTGEAAAHDGLDFSQHQALDGLDPSKVYAKHNRKGA